MSAWPVSRCASLLLPRAQTEHHPRRIERQIGVRLGQSNGFRPPLVSAALAAKKFPPSNWPRTRSPHERHDANQCDCVRDFERGLQPPALPTPTCARREEAAARPARDVHESYNIAGLPTTGVFRRRRILRRRKTRKPVRGQDAGGVILGKTNVRSLADWRHNGYGTTNNPSSRPHAGRAPPALVGGARRGLWTAVARLRYRWPARAGVSLRRLRAQADVRLVAMRGHAALAAAASRAISV